MSVAGVMLVKDEADIVGDTIRHLLDEVDHVYVLDNLSTDGSREIIAELKRGGRITLFDDDEVGHWQSEKTTRVALRALEEGFDWVVPCDADEWWEAEDGRRLADFLGGQTTDTYIVSAPLFNYVPTAVDPPDGSPFDRLGWRLREPRPQPKVAARLLPELVIAEGNHAADYTRRRRLSRRPRYQTTDGLVVRHFTWRTPDQYLRKIRNGVAAYAATDLPPTLGWHWRMWEGADDEAIRAHFLEHFFKTNPASDESLVYDPIHRRQSGAAPKGSTRG